MTHFNKHCYHNDVIIYIFFTFRNARITNLCSVMGISHFHDPDPTYELTTDNVEKILAIHMRFRLVLLFYPESLHVYVA